jgi:hypothetical protein
MLALACICYGRPGSWDISHIPQVVLGEGKDSTQVPSARLPPTLKSERDKSKGERKGNVPSISCGMKQSNSALSQNTHHSLIIKVSLSVHAYIIDSV